MSSVKVWGIDTSTDKLIHINDVTDENKGLVKCTSPTCDCTLIVNRGAKKMPYFRHPANSKCTGGSAESVVHKFVKSVYASILVDPYKLPSGYFIFKGSTSICDKSFETGFGNEINVEKNLPDTKIRPDIWFKTSDEYYNCVEILFSHNISQETRSKYKKFAKENKLRVYIVNVSHLKDIVNDLTKDLVKEQTSMQLELSTEKFKLESKAKTGEFKAFTGDIVCPATSTVTNTRTCKNCCFYSGTANGIMTCYGKECFKSLVDLTNSRTKEERFDIYSELVTSPKEVEKEVFDLEANVIHPLGRCTNKDCNGVLTLVRGDLSPRIKGIRMVKGIIGGTPIEKYTDEFREGIYLQCNSCGMFYPLMCSCGHHIKAWKNNSPSYRSCGSIFIGCCNRDTLPDGTCTSDTLTIFTDETCTRYADELKTVKYLANFLSKDKRALKKLYKLRGYDIVEKKFKGTR